MLLRWQTNIDMWWDTFWITPIYTSLISVSPVELLSGRKGRVLWAAQGTEALVMCHVNHSRQAFIAGSGIAHFSSAHRGESLFQKNVCVCVECV